MELKIWKLCKNSCNIWLVYHIPYVFDEFVPLWTLNVSYQFYFQPWIDKKDMGASHHNPSLYKFIYTVIEYTCSLNADRYASIFYFIFLIRYIIEKGAIWMLNYLNNILKFIHFFKILLIQYVMHFLMRNVHGGHTSLYFVWTHALKKI